MTTENVSPRNFLFLPINSIELYKILNKYKIKNVYITI